MRGERERERVRGRKTERERGSGNERERERKRQTWRNDVTMGLRLGKGQKRKERSVSDRADAKRKRGKERGKEGGRDVGMGGGRGSKETYPFSRSCTRILSTATFVALAMRTRKSLFFPSLSPSRPPSLPPSSRRRQPFISPPRLSPSNSSSSSFPPRSRRRRLEN